MTTLTQLDIANMALAMVGASPIASLTDLGSVSAITCNNQWQGALSEVSRATPWNCLTRPAQLVEIPQTPLNISTPAITSTAWAPLTVYSVNQFVTYGGATYQALITNTSTASFTNDLTAGFWYLYDTPNADPFAEDQGENYASGWGHQYQLPADFIMLSKLNDQNIADGDMQDQYEIMGSSLYTDESTAIIKYNAYVTDTTQFDSLFINALALNLAGRISTKIRADDGAMQKLLAVDYRKALGEAINKNSGEKKARRFSPVQNSRFIASRWSSTNN